MAMASRSIVGNLNVLEDVYLGEFACSVDLFPDSRLLQPAEERPRNRIVPAIPSTAHAGIERVRLHEAQRVVTAVLTSLVAMHEDLLRAGRW